MTAAPSPTILPPALAPWPTVDWTKSTPETQGFDTTKLDAIWQKIPPGFTSVLVVRHGYLVAEKYFGANDASHKITLFSCTKSITSALVGIAIGQGRIGGVKDPVLSYFKDRRIATPGTRKDAMTIENVLTMRSGFDWPEWTEELNVPSPMDPFEASPDWVQFMLDRPLATDPGTKWNYNSGSMQLLSAILKKTTGKIPLDYAREVLFAPIGIDDLTWDGDPTGLSIGGWGIRMTPRNMARFGYLYLRDGRWDGRQIVPPDWVKASQQNYTTTIVPGTGYGYLWWITDYGYEATGYGGQRIAVIADKDMVVVITAWLSGDDATYVPDEIIRQIVAAAK